MELNLDHQQALGMDHKEALDLGHKEARDLDHQEALDFNHLEALDLDHRQALDLGHQEALVPLLGKAGGTGSAILQDLNQYMEAALVLVQVQEEVGGVVLMVGQWTDNQGQSGFTMLPWLKTHGNF